MSLRGEFIRADELVIPNNIMLEGAAYVLAAAFQADAAASLYVGLCDAVPAVSLGLDEITEPTIGVGNYARQEVASSAVGWPTAGVLNNERFIETDWIIFPAGAYSEAVQRLFLTQEEDAVLGAVLALGSAFPASLQITALTAEADRKFKYRVYLR